MVRSGICSSQFEIRLFSQASRDSHYRYSRYRNIWRQQPNHLTSSQAGESHIAENAPEGGVILVTLT